MTDYMEYIKCGEILKLPSLDYSDQYILRCDQCQEYYCLLESFIFHCASHCNEDGTDEKSAVSNINRIYNEAIKSLRKDVAEIEILTKKYEDEMETLSLVNYEPVYEIEKINVKEESSLRDSEEYVHNEDDGVEELMEEEQLSDQSEDINAENTESDYEDTPTAVKCETIYESEKINKKGSVSLRVSQQYDNHEEEIVDESMEEEQLSDHSEDINAENSESDNEDSEDSNYPIFVNSFMKSKLSVTTLIAAYRKQTYLWNSNFPQFAVKENRQKCLQLIKKELNNKLHLQISCNHVAAVLTHLCRKYIEDLKHSKSNEELREPQWYFKHLNFLDPFAENDSLTKFDCQLNLGNKQIIEILAIYERFPHLWNTDLIENVCRNKRLEALGQMQAAIDSELGLKLSENALKKNIQFIHNHFTKIKRYNGNSTRGRSKYYKHMTFLSDHVGPFKCSDCGQEFKSPLTFRVHKAQHDGSTALKCSLCDKEYTKTGPYISHARRHMEDLSEECKECGKKFLVACELKIHMRCHTGAKPYCCEICGVSFRHSNALTAHRRRHQKQYLHNCPICSKGYYTKDKMNDHIRSHNNIRDFVCKTCGKAFITKKTLQQHEVTHEDVRKFACELCGKTFKLKVGLNQHMRTHGGQI